MNPTPARTGPVPPSRLPTGVPGLDTVLGGGLLVGDAYLVVGPPGSGKTTLGNQLAFAHARAGGIALVVTLMTETHDRMLGHLSSFGFFDPSLPGSGVRYLSLLTDLETGGVDGLLEGLRRAVRDQGATLLIVDGTSAAEALAPSDVVYGRFAAGLQVRAGYAGCTTVLLSTGRSEGANAVAPQVDGVLELSLEAAETREIRRVRVAKLRGSAHLNGWHRFVIAEGGVEVSPRLEAALRGTAPQALGVVDRRPLGVAGLDAMLGGGVPDRSATLVLGTPGAGKTILGLHFLADGARRGEPGMVASFHETADGLVATAEAIGMGLAPHAASGLVRVFWRAPLELSPDAWAWEVLAAVDEHRPTRLVIDAFTDVAQYFTYAGRQVPFLTALTKELQARGVTTLVNTELDAYAGPSLLPPIPAVSAALDNGILLRTAELGSRLVRVVSVLKARQIGFDHAIRSFAIGARGMAVGGILDAETGLLTGEAHNPGPLEEPAAG